MRVVLVAHGQPPEQVGGVELATQALAQALARRGDQVLVVAGSTRRSARAGEVETSEARDGPVRVLRIHRHDLYFDHWHKSLAPGVTRAFRAALREFAPQVVHLQHWLRLSRDLVLAAAREGVPALVTLHDAWTSCPIAFRVRTDTHLACDAPVGPQPCIACAGRLAPRTPWVGIEASFMALAERQRDLERELRLARVRIAPTAAHARDLERFLGLEAGALAAEIVPPARATRLAPAPPIAAFDGRQPLLLGAWGQLAPHKGQDVLLDALALTRAPRRVALRLAGGESDAPFVCTLRERARDLDVQFLGAFEAAQLARHPVSHVHAAASGTRARESYGVVLDEARELGLAALFPDAAAFVERRGADARGIELYEQGSAAALARVLDAWLADPDAWARLAQQARAAARATPSLADVVARHIELYERALALGAPAVAEAEWFEARLGEELLGGWDRALAQRTPRELGFEAGA